MISFDQIHREIIHWLRSNDHYLQLLLSNKFSFVIINHHTNASLPQIDVSLLVLDLLADESSRSQTFLWTKYSNHWTNDTIFQIFPVDHFHFNKIQDTSLIVHYELDCPYRYRYTSSRSLSFVFSTQTSWDPYSNTWSQYPVILLTAPNISAQILWFFPITHHLVLLYVILWKSDIATSIYSV